MKIDMHIHSLDWEDCYSEPEDVVDEAIRKGLDAICITNHNSFEASRLVKEAGRRKGFPVFVGAEYSSSDGHLLVYGFQDESYVKQKQRPAQEVIDYVTKKGGVVIPAHPFTEHNSHQIGTKLPKLRNLIALETINSRRTNLQNHLAEVARGNLGLKGIGGSDAHFANGVGDAYTEFQDRVSTMQELVHALKHGKYEPHLYNTKVEELHYNKPKAEIPLLSSQPVFFVTGPCYRDIFMLGNRK